MLLEWKAFKLLTVTNNHKLRRIESVAVDIVTLFRNIETMYVLFSKSNNAEDVFEEVQQSQGLPVRSLKRLNTARWSSRELCLTTLFERHDSVVLSLEKIKAGSAFEVKLSGKADGLLTSIQARQFMTTAFFFREIFAVTGPLSRYLQTVDIDFSNAVSMIDSAVTSLQKIRDMPDDIFRLMADDDFET